jgi:mannobiose 2-epimerase
MARPTETRLRRQPHATFNHRRPAWRNTVKMKTAANITASLILALLLSSCSESQPAQDARLLGTATARNALADEIETSLRDELFAAWYPRVVDTDSGGYLTQWNADWELSQDQTKMIVTQARHTWTTAKAAESFPDDTAYLEMSAHGFRFLRDKMWDRQYGGFFWTVSRDGTPLFADPPGPDKQAYGHAFGIYGLAAYYAASGNEEALQLAQQAFHWLDEQAHDPEFGGYFQNLRRDGTPLPPEEGPMPPKDQNSSIHILEAFTELYHVWPDSLLRVRLNEMLEIIRDTIAGEKAYLTLFSHADWRPYLPLDSSGTPVRGGMMDHVSFGHDVETAFLMLEAAEALGLDLSPTLERGKAMVDHSLRWGWDDEVGGFYDGGEYNEDGSAVSITLDSKNWWTQAEGLNSLLLFGDLYPNDPLAYHDKFLLQWSYINANLIDHERGGWYIHGIDGEPEAAQREKGGIWKSAYHDGRALMNVIARLREATAP